MFLAWSFFALPASTLQNICLRARISLFRRMIVLVTSPYLSISFNGEWSLLTGLLNVALMCGKDVSPLIFSIGEQLLFNGDTNAAFGPGSNITMLPWSISLLNLLLLLCKRFVSRPESILPILMNLRDGWTYGYSALWMLGSCGRSDDSAFGANVPSLFNSLLLCVSCIISARLGTSIGSFVKVGLDGGSIAPSSIIDVFSN